MNSRGDEKCTVNFYIVEEINKTLDKFYKFICRLKNINFIGNFTSLKMYLQILNFFLTRIVQVKQKKCNKV